MSLTCAREPLQAAGSEVFDAGDNPTKLFLSASEFMDLLDAEANWLTAHPPEPCYADAFTSYRLALIGR